MRPAYSVANRPNLIPNCSFVSYFTVTANAPAKSGRAFRPPRLKSSIGCCGWRLKDRLCQCAMNILLITRQGRRVAQAALELCRSLERRDLVTFISSMSLNAERMACRTPAPWKSRQHKRWFRYRQHAASDCRPGAPQTPSSTRV
jgi:hypothetical protein